MILAAAFVAAPAFAQTNDPNLTQKQVDCLNRTTTAGSDCDKDGRAKNGKGTPGTAGGAVFLPALIIDLFPNPPAAPQAPAPSGGTSSSNGSGNT
ncbi:MAG: peptidase S8, partial [Mesorhizobium sp.]